MLSMMLANTNLSRYPSNYSLNPKNPLPKIGSLSKKKTQVNIFLNKHKDLPSDIKLPDSSSQVKSKLFAHVSFFYIPQN